MKIIIEVKNGLIQAVYTENPDMQIEIRDYDSQELNENGENEPEVYTMLSQPISDELPDTISIEWSIDDIIGQALGMKEDDQIPKVPTKEEARKLLRDIGKNHDACLGITWDTIDTYILDYFENKGE